MDDFDMLLVIVGDLELLRRKLLMRIAELEARVAELETNAVKDS